MSGSVSELSGGGRMDGMMARKEGWKKRGIAKEAEIVRERLRD